MLEDGTQARLLRGKPFAGSCGFYTTKQLPEINYSKVKQCGDLKVDLPHYGCVSWDKLLKVSERAS